MLAPHGNAPARVVKVTPGSSGAVFDGWSRPADWLALPLIVPTDQIFVGLFAVYNTANNWVTLRCSGAYAVDWGDGSAIENVATATTVTHNVAWANVSSGTLTSAGYRQVIITCTPQAGQSFSSIDVMQKPAGTTSGQSSQWLDISVEMNNTGNFIGFYSGGSVYPNNLLQGFRCYGTNTISDRTNFHFNNSALKQSWLYTNNAISFASFYQSCSGAASFPLINTTSGTNFTGMYNGCSGAASFPLINTAAGTTFTTMYYGCSNAPSFPLINTASGTNFTGMYNGCSGAASFPLINTAAGTIFSGMYQSCSSATSFPLINTASGTNFTGMYNGCTNAPSFPLINTASGTNFTSMYASCSSATSLPDLNLSPGTDFTSMHLSMGKLASTLEYGARYSISYASCALPKAAIEAMFANLGIAAAGATRTVTVTGNVGNDTVVSRSAGTTTGSATVTQANTASLATGMLVSGTGISDAVAVTFTDGGDLVSRTAHGLANGTEVSFAAIVTTTGVAVYTRYYVVSQATDNFQVSLTLGGSPIALTTDGSGTLLYGSFIQSIVPNTSITLSAPASATGTITAVHSILNTSTATLKGWAVAR
jgi:hypothetical protein